MVPDHEIARGNQHGAAAIGRAGIDGRLHGGGIERFAVPLGAVITHVVDSNAGAGALRIGGHGERRRQRRGGRGREPAPPGK